MTRAAEEGAKLIDLPQLPATATAPVEVVSPPLASVH
jgi:hypothetical protein